MRMRLLVLSGFTLLTALSTVTLAMGGAPMVSKKAIVVIQPVGDFMANGVVHFDKVEGGVRVHGQIKGLSPGRHGFHIHQYGDLRNEATGASAGGHFNPFNFKHGHAKNKTETPAHEGDLGNILADNDGISNIDRIYSHLCFHGRESILGRAVVVHQGRDDLVSQPSGNAGKRVGFGVIGIAKP